ncbi:hypothetical protein [uncultured Thiodictyon sp.]|uniref:hypothetical protein n=1 Tax=uncultured Thiodictyon sp. TaxID=1846217 RepID=UPI0025FE37B4|nr:hypothetical protein [uncultured Thiodictyon sp.]
MSLIGIDATLSAEQSDKIKAAVAAIIEALPFLVDLNPKDRAERIKFGEKNFSFVIKMLAVALANPKIFPADFPLEEFRTDVQLIEALYPILHSIQALLGKIEDTYFAAGSEAYAAALLAYHYAKLRNVATGELEDSLDDLGQRFARKSKKTASSAASATPST